MSQYTSARVEPERTGRRGDNGRNLHPNHAIELLHLHGAKLEYFETFFSDREELLYREELERIVEFDSREASRVFVHGQWRNIPRRQCAFGDDDCPPYRFSGTSVRPKKWIEPLARLRDRITVLTGAKSNFVLVNYYAHGGDYISWHADDERDLNPTAPIASISLGSPRDFQMRAIDRLSPIGTVTFRLAPGSLLMMHPPTNNLFEHCVPKRVNAGPRWNLTFREMNAVLSKNSDEV